MLAAPAKAVHLLAGAAWLGGLLWLTLGERSDRDHFTREALRVSSVALWASIAVAGSGVSMALLFLSTPRDLVDTAYGAVLLAKIVGLIGLVAFGAYHRFRALPALRAANVAPATLAATVRRELALMVVVVLLGGFLAYVPPGRPAGRAASSPPAPIE
jgi:putative copper export protein